MPCITNKSPFPAIKVYERLFLQDPFRATKAPAAGAGSLVVGGSVRLQQTLTSCVAPLGKFTSLRQPVKGGNTTLITISRAKLHETTLRSIQPWTHVVCRASPFFSDLHIILPSSTTLRHFRIKQDVRRVTHDESRTGNSRSVAPPWSWWHIQWSKISLKERAVIARNSVTTALHRGVPE